MKKSAFGAALAALALISFSSTTLAQTGTLDQTSPYAPGTTSSWFNVDAPSIVWQAQVRCGHAGQLAGFNLKLDGPVGAQGDVGVRIGDGWNTSALVFTTQLTKLLAGHEVVFVNTTSAGITLANNDTFVIELQGNQTGCGVIGSYVDPNIGPALYPEPLYLGGPGCFAGCGWRIGFETYMLSTSQPVVYCTPGTSSNGCTANISASANPTVTYSVPCQITVNNVEGQKTGIVFYGLQQTVQPWCSQGGGTSFLCVKAPTKRTGVQSAGGTAGLCNGSLSLNWNSFQQNNPGALGAPWGAGQNAFLQAWYRDPPSCKTTSLSNAVKLTYLP
jgi:hypothetical protein